MNLWCTRRDLNPYDIITRPSNVRVCHSATGAFVFVGATDRNRTCDLALRRRSLYPTELRPRNWSERRDLNARPLPPQGSALPSCATSRFAFILYTSKINFNRRIIQKPCRSSVKIPSYSELRQYIDCVIIRTIKGGINETKQIKQL